MFLNDFSCAADVWEFFGIEPLEHTVFVLASKGETELFILYLQDAKLYYQFVRADTIDELDIDFEPVETTWKNIGFGLAEMQYGYDTNYPFASELYMLLHTVKNQGELLDAALLHKLLKKYEKEYPFVHFVVYSDGSGYVYLDRDKNEELFTFYTFKGFNQNAIQFINKPVVNQVDVYTNQGMKSFSNISDALDYLDES